jgi:hypothetical protein
VHAEKLLLSELSNRLDFRPTLDRPLLSCMTHNRRGYQGIPAFLGRIDNRGTGIALVDDCWWRSG